MASSSSSSSSSSSVSRNWRYDVFPSFSGEDIRGNFLSHFLKEFDRRLIYVFKDNAIKRGLSLDPALKQAIRDSMIAVVLFSKKYASSSWCLNELLEILKCQEEFGQLVIPIFYRLEPSDVRKQRGEFGRIFKDTCKNKTKEVKNQWQNALTYATNLFGHHIGHGDDEADIIERIVDNIVRNLPLRPSNDFEDLPGLNDHTTKMKILLDLRSQGVKMVGIWGPSGIGKTTIARALFSQLTLEFQGSIFIDGAFISESQKKFSGRSKDDYGMKLHMQSKFLSTLLKIDVRVDNLGAVSQMLSHRKVLVVIDELDQMVVLEALAMQTQWFGPGSRIIVVTNDSHLLTAHGIDCIYNVDLPSEALAIQILCRNAFGENSPPTGFEEFVVEVVRCAGSLPLGLSVLGAHLRGRDKEDWEHMLPTLQRSLDGRIERTLRVSYDGLAKEEKDLFRHIACLFNLEKVSDIKLLLADTFCDFDIVLQRLLEMSLVHLRLGIVEMNVLLQVLGKEIVVDAQSYNPEKREFLVNPKEICEILEDCSGTGRILGISLNIDEIDDNELHLHEDAFKGMCNLRFLNIFSNKYLPEKRVRLHVPDSFDYLPPKLRLLCWERYPVKTLPSNFNPENLIKLKMKNSKLKKLWKGTRPLRGLKEINLWGSENLKEIPNLSMATNLEKLYLENRLSWGKVPSSERLGMLEYRNLETLPTGSNVESCKGLMISLKECSRLYLEKLIDVFSMPLIHMGTTLPVSLTVLFLSDIPSMVELPCSIKNLNKLTDLKILRCTNLVTLPTGINLESLERLNLNGCSRLRTFPDISRNISSLYLEETAIEEVPLWIENFSNLKYLSMQRCSKLEWVYLNLSKLKLLELVNFSYCGALTGVDLNCYMSDMAIEADNIYKLPIPEEASTSPPDNDVPEEASTSLPDNDVPKVDFSFINCFNLDQESLLQQSSLEKFIMSGEEMPSYFTHQSTGTSLAISLPEAHLSPPVFRFRACAVVVFNSKPTFGTIGVSMNVNCRFKGKLGNQFDSPYQEDYFSVFQKGSYLFILDYSFPLNEEAEVNYNHVDIKLQMSSGNSKFELKGWGIRLSEDCSSPENRLGNPITLPRLCDANGDNMDNG